jgi:hypothetical protein
MALLEVYNGTAFTPVRTAGMLAVATTNVGNAYSVTIPGATYSDGQQISVKFNAASSGSVTLNINSLGAKAVVDYFGNAVTNVRANLIANLAYEATAGNFILQGKGGGGNATAAQILSGKTATTDAGPIAGTLADYSGANQVGTRDGANTGVVYLVIPAGNYSSTSRVEAVDANLTAANIPVGTTIFGLAGALSAIKSIQRGTITPTIATNATVAVTISSVVPANCLVLFPGASGEWNGSDMSQAIPANLSSLSATQLVIGTGFNSTVMNFSVGYVAAGVIGWEVIEFNSSFIKSNQQGIVVNATTATSSITISSVNTAKSLILLDGNYSYNSGLAQVKPYVNSFSSTSLVVAPHSSQGTINYGRFSWQVIEFN